MTTRITIRKPDDWHLHVRDGEMLKATLPFTAAHFGRAILMPNVIPPVRTTADGIAYRERTMAALPNGSTFKPLITCYLTDDTDPRRRRARLTRRRVHRREALSRQRGDEFDGRHHRLSQDQAGAGAHGEDRHFLMHGEDVDPAVDVFDREASFCEKYLGPWTREFPA